MIAMLNYVSVNSMIHLAKTFNSTLIHMSSLKVGSSEDFNPACDFLWRGPRSPYAWSKLAAELKLLSSDLNNISFIRIGLMDSIHAKKFYQRVRACVNFKVAVTQEKTLQDAIEEAIVAKGRKFKTCDYDLVDNLPFYRRMSGRYFLLIFPVWFFNFVW